MVKTTAFFIFDQLLEALILLNTLMPGVNYVILGCFSARTTPGVSPYWSFNSGGKCCCS